MQVRINVSLPEQTIRVLDRAVKKGDRSRFIDAAIRRYLKQVSRARLRKELAEGYRERADETLALAEEWFPIDEEAWQKSATRNATKRNAKHGASCAACY